MNSDSNNYNEKQEILTILSIFIYTVWYFIILVDPVIFLYKNLNFVNLLQLSDKCIAVKSMKCSVEVDSVMK